MSERDYLTISETSKQRGNYWPKLGIGIILFLACALVIVGRVNESYFSSIRLQVQDGLLPVTGAVSKVGHAIVDTSLSGLQFWQTREEMTHLRQQNEKLRIWQTQAYRLQEENQQLRKLLNYKTKDFHQFITARIVANTGNTFERSFIINAGKKDSVKKGQPVLMSGGVIGRVYEVGQKVSEVLLLTDINSRIPVVIKETGKTAILRGDNSLLPHLDYTQEQVLKIGQHIVTSGTGSQLPSGLPVGQVIKVNKNFRVELYANFMEHDFVRILQ